MCTASTTTAGTGIVEVKYWYDEVGPYADSCQMAILEVDPTPTSITLEPDEEVVVDAQAVPNPADVGAILEWSMDWESVPAGDADLEPEGSSHQETTLFTAVSFGTGNLVVKYMLSDKTAYGTVPVTVAGVLITLPEAVDLGVNDETSLQVNAGPAGGTFAWSIVEGGNPAAGGTFSPSASTEDPAFKGTTAGTGRIRCQYSVGGNVYSDSVPVVVREVEITTAPQVLPVNDTYECVVTATPAIDQVAGLLTWTLDGGAASFVQTSDTEAVMIADEAGWSTMHVRYEGAGVHQGYDEDTKTVTLISVTIETAPAWVLSDSGPVECVAVALPPPAETDGTLTWSLIDPDTGAPVNWATFNPNGTQGETTLFSVSTSDSGQFTLRVGYTVDGVTAYDREGVEVIGGEIRVVPQLAFLSTGATYPFTALDGDGLAYDTTEVTWSIDEGSGSFEEEGASTGMYEAPSDAHGRMVIKCTKDGTGGLVYDTAVVGVIATDLDSDTYAYYGSLHGRGVVKVDDDYYAQDKSREALIWFPFVGYIRVQVPTLVYWAHYLSNDEIADVNGNPVEVKRRWGWVPYNYSVGEGGGETKVGVPNLQRWINVPNRWTVVSESDGILFYALSCVAQLFGYPSLDEIRKDPELGISKNADHELACSIHWGYGQARLRCEWYPERAERKETVEGANLTVVRVEIENPQRPTFDLASKGDSDDILCIGRVDPAGGTSPTATNVAYSILPTSIPVYSKKMTFSSNGQVVRAKSGSDIYLGQNKICGWNGKKESGEYMAEETYKAKLSVTIATGQEAFESEEHEIVDLAVRHRPIVYLHAQEFCPPVDAVFHLKHYQLFRKDGSYVASGVKLDKLLSSYNSSDYYANLYDPSDDVGGSHPKSYPDCRRNLPTGDVREVGARPAIYVRTVPHKGAGGQYAFVQYWMYETASTLPISGKTPLTVDVFHEGDWEFFQVAVLLDTSRALLQPVSATYSMHYYGLSLRWTDNEASDWASPMEVWHDGHRPRIYMAGGSHATYPYDRPTNWHTPDFWATVKNLGSFTDWFPEMYMHPTMGTNVYDVCGGEELGPYSLLPLDTYANWLGHWGARSYMDPSSGPKSPRFKEGGDGFPYTKPRAYHNLKHFLGPACEAIP